LPSLFPELEVLHCSLSCAFGSVVNVGPGAPNVRLRELTLEALIRSFGDQHLTSEVCGHVLRIIFAAAPHLTMLKLHHGEMHVSGSMAKAGVRKSAFPGVDGALAELPASLTSLDLGEITLRATDFDMHPGPLALQRLVLRRCGLEAVSLAKAILVDRAKCPQLLPKGIFTSDGTAYSPLVCLDPLVEQKAMASKDAAAKKKADTQTPLASLGFPSAAAAAGASGATVATDFPGGAGPSGSRPESSLAGGSCTEEADMYGDDALYDVRLLDDDGED